MLMKNVIFTPQKSMEFKHNALNFKISVTKRNFLKKIINF